MSRHDTHRRLSKLLTGDPHNEVNRLLDLPALFYGRRHRRFFHDPLSAPAIGAFAAWRAGKSPVSGALAGWAHIILDFVSSWIRRRLF